VALPDEYADGPVGEGELVQPGDLRMPWREGFAEVLVENGVAARLTGGPGCPRLGPRTHLGWGAKRSRGAAGISRGHLTQGQMQGQG
jgi:hypothetical protein